MRTPTEQAFAALYDERPEALQRLPPEFVMPAYGGRSIASIPATMASVLEADLPGMPPLAPDISESWQGARKVVFVLLDGVGYLRFRRFLEENPDSSWHRILEKGNMTPITSVFPSTTTNALTTIWTGRPPAFHGVLGYHLYLKRFGVVINTITFSPWFEYGKRNVMEEYGLVPEGFVQTHPIGVVLGAQGVTVDVLTYYGFIGSCLSRMHTRGAHRIRGYIALSDFAVALRQMTEELPHDRRSLLMAYWAPVDTLSHAYGPSSEVWDAEMRLMGRALEEEFLNKLSGKARQDTLLVIVADHGHVDILEKQTIRVQEHPALYGALSMPTAWESRATTLYVKPGREAEVREYLNHVSGGAIEVISRENALESGLLGGPLPPEYEDRIGNLVALSRRGWAIEWARPRHPLIGRHGGLDEQEMIVPLISVRL